MGNLIHNTIKIQLVNQGYLPNCPYHLISDAEMCDAFLRRTSDSKVVGYFVDHYPCLDSSLQTCYDSLVSRIEEHLTELRHSTDEHYEMPGWVYAYMLGNVISVHSTEVDKLDLIRDLSLTATDFDAEVSAACYKVSSQWLGKRTHLGDNRPPTLFGEPHVLKRLRILKVGM